METDEAIQPVFQVHTLPWRRNIDDLLKIVDDEALGSRKGTRRRGAVPRRRTRPRTGIMSTREPPRGLPKSFYGEDWLNGLDDEEKEDLGASDEKWPWVEITRG